MATSRLLKWALVAILVVIWWPDGHLVTALALDPAADPCSEVWPGSQYHDNYCYKVIEVEDKIQWHQLENLCTITKCSGEPAQPKTGGALRFVQNLARMKSADEDKGSPNVWLGAYRNTSLHPLRWACNDQEVDTTDKALWSELTTASSGADDQVDWNCLALHGAMRKVQIRDCLEDGYAVCQMHFGKPCEQAYFNVDICLKYHGEKMTLDEAQAICQMEGAVLADISMFSKYQLLRRLDFEMNGEVMTSVLPPSTEAMPAPSVDIPVSESNAQFAISACGGFIVALTYGQTAEDMRDTIQFRFESEEDGETEVTGELCRGGTENCKEFSESSLPVKMRCEDWWSIKMTWNKESQKIWVNDTYLQIDRPRYQGVFVNNTIRLRSSGDGPGLVRSLAPGSVQPPSTWLGTYRDTTDGNTLKWTSTQQAIRLDQERYSFNMTDQTGHMYMDGMRRHLKANATKSSRKSFICQKRILENTHSMVIEPSDENKTLAITTEDRVAILVNVVDFMGLMSMSVSTSWLTKGHPWTLKLSDSASVLDDSDLASEDTSRTLTIFSTHPNIAVSLLEAHTNKSNPVIPLSLLSNTYLVTTLATFGTIEILAILEGKTMVNFNCSDYTYLRVFLDDNTIDDPKSGEIPMYHMDKVVMELHSDRIWLYIEASQLISLLTFDKDGESVSILPGKETTSQYTSVPSYPLSSNSNDTFTILALEDDLVQEENGVKSFATLTVDDVQVVRVESGSYHTVTSENSLYVTKLDEDNEPVGTCSMTNHEYDQNRAAHEIMVSSSETGDVITLLAVVGGHMTSTLLLNDEPNLMTCEAVPNSSQFGCTSEIEPGFYTLTSTTAEPFQVYVTVNQLDGLFCQYLGSSPNTKTRRKRAVTDRTDTPYRTEVYITAPLPSTLATTEPQPGEEAEQEKPVDPPNKFLNVSVGKLVEIIRTELAVDEKETSQYKRKKISVADHRFSSKAIASVGVFFVVFAISFVVFFDCIKLASVVRNVDVVNEVMKKEVKA